MFYLSKYCESPIKYRKYYPIVSVNESFIDIDMIDYKINIRKNYMNIFHNNNRIQIILISMWGKISIMYKNVMNNRMILNVLDEKVSINGVTDISHNIKKSKHCIDE